MIKFVYKIVVGDQMKKIILIEDDEILSSGIESYLSKNDFEVETCKNFEEAKIKINNSFDLAILDINLPDNDGIGLLNTLRENNVRVIITTVKNDEKFIVRALDNGADDYITKPFKLSILRARIDKTLRTALIKDDFIRFKDLTLNNKEGNFYYKNKKLDLTSLEFQVMKLFINNPNRIFTRDFLLERFWDRREKFVNDNTLTATIKRIRDKSDRDIIKTIRGIGYRMNWWFIYFTLWVYLLYIIFWKQERKRE